ncbi:MAG: LLM class F420-dependent oxidoreductase, partial [Chloroflexota bacterium]
DGWYPSAGNGEVDSPERVAVRGAQLRRMLAEAGRDPWTVDIGVGTGKFNQGKAERAAGGGRAALTGSTEEVADDIRAYAQAGARHLLVRFPGETRDELADNMERFMKEVAPLVAG